MTYERAPEVRTLLTTLRSQRHVLRNFVARDLKVKYRGTVLGYLWSLLEPMSLVLVYYFVFEIIAKRGGPGYPLIIVLGVLPYNLLGSIIQAGATSLTNNAALIRRVYLPREVFVFSSVASNVVFFGLSLLAVIPFMVAYQTMPGWRLIYVPFATLLMAMFATGIALAVACANALFRDVTYVIRVVLRLFFYGSPTIYTVAMVPDDLRPFYALNPVAIYLSLVRNGVMNTAPPFGPEHVLASAISALVVFWGGYALFQRWQAKAVKFL